MAIKKSFHAIADHLLAHTLLFHQTLAIPKDFDRAIEIILKTQGRLVLCGVGKSGYIARKIHTTLLSLGIKSSFMHAAEALHGDLGSLGPSDTLLLLTHSGKSHESLMVWQYAGEKGIPRIAITSNTESLIARSSDALLDYPQDELCAWKRLPTLSTQAMLIYGDIIALTLQHALDIQEAHYLQHHPAGSHGIDAQKIIHLYDKIETIPVLPGKKTLYETMEHIQSYRKGYALIVDEASKLLGIFTDGDLRRALLAYADLTDMVSQWMTPNPITLRDQMNVAETKALFKKHKITAAPVLDEKDNILGMIEHFHIGHIA